MMTALFSFFLSHTFMLRALFAGVLLSLCCALLGVSLVLKRFSMIGDGLSHVGFGALAVACAANVAPLPFSIPIVVLAAFLLLFMNQRGALKGDAAIALISTGALALGVMVTSLTTGMNVDIYNYMFGSILAVKNSDLVLSALLCAAVIVLFCLFYEEIFAVTFDESFAKATGTRVNAYNMLIALLTAVTIVVGMRMMGALLISSLIIFPCVMSMRVCKSFKRVVCMSAAVSVVCFVLGLAVSVRFEAPTGASVVCVNLFFLAVFALLGAVLNLPQHAKLFRFRRILAVLLAGVLVCGAALPFFGGVRSAKKEKLSVVATSFAPYDFARAVGGDCAEVTMLLAPGEESHTFEPTPNDLVLLEQCDVFVYGGGESDVWADAILASLDTGSKQIVRMMDVVALQEEMQLEGMQAEDDEEEDVPYDEHVWTSAFNAQQITEAVCDALCAQDSANENCYRANAKAYIAQLKTLDRAFFDLAAQTRTCRFLVGDRFPFQYFMRRYGFSFYAAFPGCSAEADANPATVGFLVDRAKTEHISTVFKVDLSSGAVAGAIADAAGCEVATLYSCHVISAEDFAGGETYLSLMQRNLAALKSAAGIA